MYDVNGDATRLLQSKRDPGGYRNRQDIILSSKFVSIDGFQTRSNPFFITNFYIDRSVHGNSNKSQYLDVV